MALRSKYLLALIVCFLMAFASSGLGSARAEDGSGSVAEARKRLSVAGDAAAAAEDRVAEIEKRVGDAQERLQDAEGQRSSARRTTETAHTDATIAARKSRRASATASDADEQALAARGAVMRLARDGYAGSIASMDLLLVTEFLADGSVSLGDFSQQLLASMRVQGRLIDLAEATAMVATNSRAQADEKAAERKVARKVEKTAQDALSQTRKDVASAKSDLAKIKRKERSVLRAARKADDRYDDAQSSFKKAFLAACTSGAGYGTQSSAPASSGSRAKVVWDVLLANGFTQEAAAGILGNLQQESNVDPTTRQGGGPGTGLAQWSRGGRWDNGPRSMVAFAGTRGLDIWDAKTQVQFMIYEMSADWFDLASFKKMTDIAEATVYFHDVFERSADGSGFVNTVRVGYAQAWYAQLSGSKPASGSKGYAEPILMCPNG